ncbi:MAG: Hsp20/alpha crystallin family protein [Trueperaceae bacterium]
MTHPRYLTARNRPSRRWSFEDADMNDMFGQMERMLQLPLMHSMSQQRGAGAGRRSFPIDLYETSDEVVLVMAVPGMRPDQLDISLEGRQLSIRGTLPEAEEGADETEERSYWVRSIPRGEFQRIVTVPAGVDADAIQATVDQGLLTLTLPKATEAKARKIDVQQLGQPA